MLKIGVVGGIKIYGGNSMKDEIKLNGIQEFMGKEIPIIEGALEIIVRLFLLKQ